jgi:hypothetical protein
MILSLAFENTGFPQPHRAGLPLWMLLPCGFVENPLVSSMQPILGFSQKDGLHQGFSIAHQNSAQ